MNLTEDQEFAIFNAIVDYFRRDQTIMREYKTYWRLLELNRPLTDYEKVVKEAVSSTIDFFEDKYYVPEEKYAHTNVKELMKTGLSQEDAVAQVIKFYDERSYDSEDEEW